MLENNKNFNIAIAVIPHDKQRYPTVGDWFWNDDQTLLTIRVSDMSDWRYHALIAVHELVEVLLCKKNFISQKEVDTFDKRYEDERIAKLNDVTRDPVLKALDQIEEPGDDVQAPYKREHCAATGFERILASGLGVDWSTYAKTVESL